MTQDDPRHTFEVYAKLRRIRSKRRVCPRVEQHALVTVLDQQRQSVLGSKTVRRPIVNDVRNPRHFTLRPIKRARSHPIQVP